MPVLTIIIPTWKRDEVFSETIAAAVEAVKNIDAEILVINDCGEDEVLFEHTKVKIYNNPGRGVSQARNSGASLAKSPILLFIDNDILITEENIVKTILVCAICFFSSSLLGLMIVSSGVARGMKSSLVININHCKCSCF